MFDVCWRILNDSERETSTDMSIGKDNVSVY